MAETSIYIKGRVVRMETRRTKRGAIMAYIWVRIQISNDLQPVVVFPAEYQPVADDLGVGTVIMVRGTKGKGAWPDNLYADCISLSNRPI